MLAITLARIMSFARDRGVIDSNPCERGGRLYVSDRTEKSLDRRADRGTPLLKSGSRRRPSVGPRTLDGTTPRWPLAVAVVAYDGPHIRLRQSKTGRRVVMPVGQPLNVFLDAAERVGPIT